VKLVPRNTPADHLMRNKILIMDKYHNGRSPEKGKITAAQAVKILAKSGCQITEQEAEKVLDLMYFLSKLIVEQNFSGNKDQAK
jgi:hypothetical protein